MVIIRSVRRLLFALMMLAVSGPSSAQVLISVNFGPPALPVYEQPFCPAEGYVWAPGYWAWSPYGYYWVPGTWVSAPEAGLLWTPGYWAFDDGLYYWHPGYWGPVVGYYGGIAYGYGYPGTGYYGGYWRGRQFYYNQTVNNVNVTNIHNVYHTTVINNTTTVNRVSYNGGPGGTMVRPTSEEEAAAHQRHVAATSAQMRHEGAARTNRNLLASVNHGRPTVAATPRPGAFRDRAAVPAKEAGGPYRTEAERGGNTPVSRSEHNVPRPPTAIHARDLPPHPRVVPPNTGSVRQEKKYQQQQAKLYAKQDEEHQRLQQKQEQEHQRLARQGANETRMREVEQRHQQQTQQMEQRHAQQWERFQTKQQPANRNQPQPR